MGCSPTPNVARSVAWDEYLGRQEGGTRTERIHRGFGSNQVQLALVESLQAVGQRAQGTVSVAMSGHGHQPPVVGIPARDPRPGTGGTVEPF
jgi:hypothetical protein